MSLARMRLVADALTIRENAAWVLTVAGTNGKGSCVAYADALLRAAGRRVGAYTSPHVLGYPERMRVDGRVMDEASIVAAFETIDAARGDVSLTYFEFATLAARLLFRRYRVDDEVLEVGLGGRLDAVNTFDANACLITSVGLDHCEWLGNDRESVGREKAGILRRGVPAVFAGVDIPNSVSLVAKAVDAPLAVAGVDYRSGRLPDGRWWYEDDQGRLDHLLPPALRGDVQYANAAGVLRALRCHPDLTLSSSLWNAAQSLVVLPGRMQRLPGDSTWWLDVAHNADSALSLRAILDAMPRSGRRYACFGLMARKDLEAVIAPLRDSFDGWYVLSLPEADARPAGEISRILGSSHVVGQGVAEQLFPTIDASLLPGDELVVFGSFRTVEEALRFRGVDSL